ncbi:outer membrane lipoprotein YidQ [Klebsiella pneumoniae]|uniref:Outer membrane lipoprotein YidQ n=1 Tax=Klebsiella pneumoniae TaxID=573 RepID=A0A3S4GH09_KLEPN|nr:outer membrane lipoprotein YidQ [Klebsiella pneumoniae]
MKSLVALDMPFTAVMDTLLLPWDMFRTDSSIQISGRKEREGYAGDQLGDPASADACPVSYRPVCVTHS